MNFSNNIRLIAFIFLFFQVTMIYYAYWLHENSWILFWFCNHSVILFSIAFMYKNYDMVKGIISVGLLGQIVWIIDFLSGILTGSSLFGFTDYIFSEGFKLYYLIPIVAHFFPLPLAFFLTIKYKPKPISLLYSLIYVLILFIASIVSISYGPNANCIEYFCPYGSISGTFYTFIWPILTMILVVLPSYYLQIFIYNWISRFDKSKSN